VRFLTRTFRNVFYVRVGKRYVRMWRLANSRLRRLVVRRKLEDARNRRRWRRSHAHCRRWGRRRRHTPSTQTEPQQRPPRALFSLKLDNSCCHARYSCGNNCNVVVKVVQECKFFNAIYFRSTETVRHKRYVS